MLSRANRESSYLSSRRLSSTHWEPYPDVRIALSTDWVGAFGFEQARDALPRWLREGVIGATCDENSDNPAFFALTRGAQVHRYVAQHSLRSWLAIDDRRDGFDPWPDQLVHCQPGVGLGDIEVQRLLAQRPVRDPRPSARQLAVSRILISPP
ncbi:HAD domain-containing protein [Cupriavidus lacunae]|uniref:HAD domain-containing protein n=1 Tax=Cupriavidus lacunae TaxID=2666307 RepID=UPI003CC51729